MKKILLITLALTAAAPASAVWNTAAKVRFDMGSGFNAWAPANVRFATGNELNRVTGTMKYDASDARYVVVPMTGGEFDVVRIAGFADCGGEFTSDCLPGGRADGFDTSGRHWQVCTNALCN